MFRTSLFVLILIARPLYSQENSVPVSDPDGISLSLPQYAEPLTPSSFLQVTLSSPPIGAAMSTVTGMVAAGYRGLFMAGIERDYAVSDPFLRTEPQDVVFLHVPLFHQQGAVPTVFLEARSMIRDCEGEFPKENVFREFMERTEHRLFGTDFRLHTGTMAVGMTTVSHEHLTVTGGLGVQILSWQQGTTYYALNATERNLVRGAGDWQKRPVGFARLSAVAAMSDRLLLNFDLRTFPLFDLRSTDFAVLTRVGHSRTLGVGYRLFPAFRFDISDQFIGGYGGHWYDHYFRFSITTGFLERE